ncbi:MAG: DNA recombination protein RmuC, partial [Pseudomonadota bacterium]
VALDDGERRRQPDMVVQLPGARVIAVDAKVSLTAYLDALEAEDEATRVACLERHANDLRTHVKALAAREYADHLRDSLDFVVMFVPGENYFAAAMETRPDLFQEAFDKKVLIATPTTLVAILKSAAYGWRQEKAAENAVAVAAMAKDIYDSLRKMGDHLAGLGKAIDMSVRKYNDLLGGVETRVLPRARKFADYELPGVDGALETPGLIENAVREPRAGRDLVLSPAAVDAGEAPSADG